MLIITKRNAPEEALDAVKEYLIHHGFDIHQSTGANRTILGVIGDTDALDARETVSYTHLTLPTIYSV